MKYASRDAGSDRHTNVLHYEASSRANVWMLQGGLERYHVLVDPLQFYFVPMDTVVFVRQYGMRIELGVVRL